MTAILETTVYMSVTALFILAFKRLFKNKMSARWHVWIWALLAVRLVLPSFPQSNFSVFNAIDIPHAEEQTVNDTILENPASEIDAERLIYGETDLPPQPIQTMPATPAEEIDNSDVKGENEQIKTTSEEKGQTFSHESAASSQNLPEKQNEGINIDLAVKWIYGIGVILLLVYFVSVYTVLRLKIGKNAKIQDSSTLALLEECKQKVGVKQKVSVLKYGNNPMLMGVIKPKIILPDTYSDAENRNIIIHELCHLKSGDILAVWLSMLVLCLNWYNPIMWFCFFMFRRDIEVYCDERVLKYVDSKKEYAALLVKTALKRNSFIAGTTSLQNGEKEVERRVKYMAYFKKPHFVWTLIVAVAAVVIGVVCLTNPKENEKEQQEQNEKDVAADQKVYTDFLENAAKVKIDDTEYFFSQYCDAYGIDGKFEYALFDMNDDGFPEFHLKSTRSYHVFTLIDGQMKMWYEGSPYETFTSDGNIFYSRYGGAPNNSQYIFKELGCDGNVVSEVSWSVYELGDRGNITDDSVFYDGDGKEISEDEYYDLIRKYDTVPYDYNWVIFYDNLKTEVWENIDEETKANITIQFPAVFGMQDLELQEKINQTIKEAALERYNDYSSDLFKDGFDNTSWPVAYTVAHYGDRFISIYFEGYIYTMGYAHGSNTCWTVNVDLSTGERIEFGDVFDDTFCEYITFENFGNGAFADAEAFEMLFGTQKEYLKADFASKSNDKFFFGDNELGISLYMYNDYFNYFTADYESLKDCMKDHPIWQELGVKTADYSEVYDKDGKVMESSKNFLLEDRIDEYYYEVYDNDGKVIYSGSSEKSPVFIHLEGPLYELRFSQGTFAWESVFFNVEWGDKTDTVDRPFYLSNGVIAFLNDLATFDSGYPTKTGELAVIELFDLYDQAFIDSIFAKFLKESTSYFIEYVDDTHISVTYYTENGNKENVEVLEIPSLTGALTKDDFKITYKGFTFDFDTTVDEVLEYFPTEEIENISYVSGSPEAKRICLSYPNAREPDINIICIQNHETGEQFIETIEILGEDIETARGMKPKYSMMFVEMNYGNGKSFYTYGVNSGSESYYYGTEGKIVFVDNADNDSLINHISFAYRPDSPESRSIDLYQKSLMGEDVSSLPFDGKINLLYASGAGAWGDYITLNADGSYIRNFHDVNMGQIGKENPNGTVYLDNETGKFDLLKLDDYTYILTVKESTHEYGYSEERIEDGVKYVSTAPEHSDVGNVYILAFPGTPVGTIPTSVMEWDLEYSRETFLPYHVLYPYGGGIGYFAYESINDETDEEIPKYTMGSDNTANSQPTPAPVEIKTEVKVPEPHEPETVPEVIPEVVPEVTPEVVPETTPEVVPETTPEVIPETPSDTEENTPVSDEMNHETETDASGLFDEENETPPQPSEESEQDGEETLSAEVEVELETDFW